MMNKELTHLLEQSVEQYSSILAYTNTLPALLSNPDMKNIQTYCGHLSDLQNEASRTDEAINSLLKKEDSDLESSPAFQKRRDLMSEIIRHNDLLFPRIAGKMAIISSELDKIKEGRTAMTGYKPNLDGSGKIINKTH